MNESAERESMEFDVVIVGGGPAGLAAACRLMQLAAEGGTELSVVVVEKGSEIGAHVLSGNVFEPAALGELFPQWQAEGAPVTSAVKRDEVHYLRSEQTSMRVPGLFVPRPMHNEGNYIISLGRLCQWLAEKAEALGVNVFPGFAASELLYDDQGRVRGVATSDLGVGKDGKRKAAFQAGYELLGRYTVLAEGCRGNLGKEAMDRYDLRANADPQHYGIGLKEIWEIDPALHEEGLVVHTLGWPLDGHTEGGGFLYHAGGNQVFLGLIVALNYRNPHLSPFGEFQRWKHHPQIARFLEGGERIGYGARAVNKGGLQSLPKLAFPGGMLIGCDAGFLNGIKIKGAHGAIKSGMLAAESIWAALSGGDEGYGVLDSYEQAFRNSWLHDELHRARNFGPGLARLGTFFGSAFTFIDQNIFRGKLPFTWRNRKPDHESLHKASEAQVIEYPRPDGIISFDRLSSVYLSSTNHEEDQPSHLRLKDPALPIAYNLPEFDEPAQRYCPAGVYEIVTEGGEPQFRINAQNCVHCKTCDIKDPRQNIVWTVPEGGGGPNYSGM
ncbi:MAG: electron transfer flavoprotein-ubiquinone oxidoreductase [Gammaproteobacteria bacterium]|nr:electron transfer flavoprotein-ubiquinone oxidoreductase [Gammaproteobacteria bacterium]MDH4253003.1 electron transfer flavoprotein-ubiquinone oxidoreductase [Gammaproteobacteria bacterium]MDH5308575.1 electron transfer flavoprotein-ubiquinone oxidoreductase [Gammaproteobacteria bacterium]